MMRKTNKDKKNISRTLHYFFEALKKSRKKSIFLTIIVLVRSALSYGVIPVATSKIIELLSSGDFEMAHYKTPLVIISLLLLANEILVRIWDWLDWNLDAEGGEYLQNLAFNAVLNQSMTFHNDHFSGSLISQTNKLASAYINFKSEFFWSFLPMILCVIISIATATTVSPLFALFLFVFSVVFVIISYTSYKRTRDADEKYADAGNKQSGQVSDSISNILSIKSFAREAHEKSRIKRANHEIYDATIGLAKASFRRNAPLSLMDTTLAIVTIVAIVYGHNFFGISVGSAVLLYNLASKVLDNMWSLNHILRTFNRSFGDAKAMVEILDMPVLMDDKTDKPLKVEHGEIEFSHISFKHKEKKVALFEDLTLHINAGERVGLVGISGSGKTTLTKLLLRFDDVNKGAIFIDGQDIRDVTQKSLRENIAYVPQESSLFHRSIEDNISYGKPEATKAEIKRAAKLANAEDFINEMPEKYKTLVGERGVKLSGGQRQRIAIARAILKDAPILVLDEATSALDSESEALIQEALDNLMKGRTALVIAHRLSTVANLDRIIVMKDGKIIEEGTHLDLLKKFGEYYKLWTRQSGDFSKL